MKRLALAALLVLSPLAAPRAAEIPPGVEQALAVAAPEQATVKSLDAVETAELQRTDADQKGGDALIIIVLVVAVVSVIYIYFQHTENMAAH